MVVGLSLLSQGRLPIKLVSISIFFGLFIYGGVVFAWTDWAVLGQLAQSLPVVKWLEIFALALLSYCLRFIRWNFFMIGLGYRLPLARHLMIYLSAFALTLTPAKVGETIRSLYLFPKGVTYHHSLAAFVSERLLDLLVVGVLASLSLILFPEHGRWIAWVLFFAFSALLLMRSKLITWGANSVFKGVLSEHANLGAQSVRTLLSVNRLVLAFPIGLFAWVSQGLALHVVLDSMGHEVAVYLAVAVYALGVLAGAASFVPGGLIVTEGTMVLLLVALGLDVTSATFAALVVRAGTLWFAIVIGVFCNLFIFCRAQKSG
jgi:glycosyltransferase 2 family protein